MTAASSAASQARRPASRPSAQAQSAPMRTAPAHAFDSDDGDEIRINLADIPRMSFALDSSMHVEGFKPTLLSRLLNLIMPKS